MYQPRTRRDKRDGRDGVDAEREPQPAPADALVALQRSAGNAAVGRLLQRLPGRGGQPRLHLASRGPGVTLLQTKLNSAGVAPQLKVDGVFGPHTLAAVRRFQGGHGLKRDGVAGSKTWAALTMATTFSIPPQRGDGYTSMDEPPDEGYSTMAPEEADGYVTMRPATLDDVADEVGEEELAAMLAPRRYVADLQVGARYRGLTGDTPEDVSSEKTLKDVIALIHAEAPKRGQPFRELFKEHFGWRDVDIDEYVDDHDTGVRPGSNVHVNYLDDEQRRPYEVTGGATLTFASRRPPQVVDTAGMFAKEEGAGYGIYVMDGSGRIYLGSHQVALFHHSSFLAAAGAAAAGGMLVSGGVVQEISNHSGHYTPQPRHLLNVIGELLDRGQPLHRGTRISVAAPKGDITLEVFLRAYKPDWLARIGIPKPSPTP